MLQRAEVKTKLMIFFFCDKKKSLVQADYLPRICRVDTNNMQFQSLA